MSVDLRKFARKNDLAFAATFIAALLFAVMLTQQRYVEVWRTGAFFDTDDAMRAVELRDFLAGQGWFDLTARRLDPPTGVTMHWSRLIDVALAAIQEPLSLFLTPQQAERGMRLLFPFTLLSALLLLSGRLGGLLAGAPARLLAIFLVMLSAPMIEQFSPGRIDHHAPQIVIAMASFILLLQGLDRRRAVSLGAVAALMALSLAISLENIPLFAPMAGALLWLFITDGVAARAQLLWFAGGALVAFPLFFITTVAPSAYTQSACDAFSAPWLAGAIAGAVGLMALALAASGLATARARAPAGVAVAVMVLAVFAGIAPACLSGPFSGLDPLVQDLWLSHVQEVMPLSALFEQTPSKGVALTAPVALGLAAAFWRARETEGLERRRWSVAAATIAVGLTASLLHIRVFSSVTPLAMAALAGGVSIIVFRLRVSAALRNTLAVFLSLFLSPIGLTLALADDQAGPPQTEIDCLTPEALGPLSALPPGRVAASFNLGAHILAHTPHEALAAPYHRNNHGNRLAAEIFFAAPERAGALTRAAGATLVAWCARGRSPLVAAAPDGLAAMLARGEVPAWLERRSTPDAPLLVFAVRSVE